jgi:putative flippase GtrA
MGASYWKQCVTTARTCNLQLPTKLQTLPRFLLVGGACACLNLAFLWVATGRFHLHYLVSTLLSFVLLNGIGFLLNKYFTFGRWNTATWHELAKYYTTMLGSTVAYLLLMALLVGALGIHYLLASIFLTGVLALVNFRMHSTLTFKTHGRRV